MSIGMTRMMAMISVLGLAGGQAGAGQQSAEAGGPSMFLSEQDVMGVTGQVLAKFAKEPKALIEAGVRQVAQLWTEKDGAAADFARFCLEHFMTGKDRDGLFSRFETKLELLAGHLSQLGLQLKIETDEDTGPLLPVDQLFAQFSPAAHLADDLFRTKLAFTVLLNFRVPALEIMLKEGSKWSRRQWAEARLAQRFSHRVPAEVNQALTVAYAKADDYISNYNIWMDHLVDAKGQPLFRQGLKLISHWGLRDEIKGQYSNPAKNLPQQEAIQAVMLRIINQEIPAAVVDNPALNWDPIGNTVDGKPAAREPDTRFERLLDVFRAHRLEDPFYPDAPTLIDRRFRLHREIPEAEFVALLEAVLKAPQGQKVATIIEKRLGRKLQPFDVWYDGFKPRGAIGEEKLDAMVKQRYPTVEAFQQDLPNILQKLGFEPKTAAFLSDRIELDPARGSGHAWGPAMRSDKAHLRTRMAPGGMNYKGFNIAMHELGHNVEQVFSLYSLDHTLLAGVPNTAFTEGFAFVFQARDLDILGLTQNDKQKEALEVIDNFWATREIAGVGLLDIQVWRWIYAHPDAGAAELRQAVVEIAKQIWNTHYAPVFGVKDSPLLAIYSHMINSGLYLPDYPLGHLIAFQVEDYLKTHPLGKEMERMCALGAVTPSAWMMQAVGKAISAEPLIRATQEALKIVKN